MSNNQMNFCNYNLQFLNNVSIINSNVLLPQEYVILAYIDYPHMMKLSQKGEVTTMFDTMYLRVFIYFNLKSSFAKIYKIPNYGLVANIEPFVTKCKIVFVSCSSFSFLVVCLFVLFCFVLFCFCFFVFLWIYLQF